MNYIGFIWKNMMRNRRRTLLTILSIALSLFVLSTLMTVLTELNREPEGEDTHLRLVVRRASSLGDPLPEAYGAKLKRVPGVRMAEAARESLRQLRRAPSGRTGPPSRPGAATSSPGSAP